MCNYSQWVFEKGYKIGYEEGYKIGYEEGRRLNLEKNVKLIMSVLIELDYKEDLIINKMSEKFNISNEVAKKCYAECSKEYK